MRKFQCGTPPEGSPDRHGSEAAPSAWVTRFASLVPSGGRILDLAAGGGRHARYFLARGHAVTVVDRDTSQLDDLIGHPGVEILAADLETARGWPLGARRFAGVIVTNYLHRPILADIVAAVAPSGALIYETFAVGNERFGKPSNPDFLLQPGELLTAAASRLRVVAYEDCEVDVPRPAMVQRIAAVRVV